MTLFVSCRIHALVFCVPLLSLRVISVSPLYKWKRLTEIKPRGILCDQHLNKYNVCFCRTHTHIIKLFVDSVHIARSIIYDCLLTFESVLVGVMYGITAKDLAFLTCIWEKQYFLPAGVVILFASTTQVKVLLM